MTSRERFRRPQVFNDCFALFQRKKLRKNERRHFRKDWLFEVASHCYDVEVSKECKVFVTKPVRSAVDDVLAIMDPDPDGGYTKTEKLDGVSSETWIPCVMSPQHLVELLKYSFKYSALQTRNQLGRTALHEACFANKVDSHFEVIRVLVDEHVQNLHAVDDHSMDARALVLAPRGRPGSPTGHRFREDIIDDHRDDLLDDYTAACQAIDDAKSKRRQRDALAEAIKRGNSMSHKTWSLLKDMSMIKRTLAGVDEFEDTDTKNRFYRWRDEDDADAQKAATEETRVEKTADQILEDMDLSLKYDWTPPRPFVFEEKIIEAIHHVRRHTALVRTVGDWETRIDSRHVDECLLYVSDGIAEAGGIGVSTWKPRQLEWDALQTSAVSVGTLGAADEWKIYELHDGQQFYVKAALQDYRWLQPIDAVEKTEAEVQCTNVTFDYKATEQPWFTCEECNAIGIDGKKVRMMICVHCAKRCHAGHEGIKYLRTSRVACMCPEMGCDLMRELEAQEADKTNVRINTLAKREAEEVRRRDELATETPSVLACLPCRTPEEIRQGAIQGWALCRRAAYTEPVDGWQILVDPTQPFETGSKTKCSGCVRHGRR